VTDSPTANSSPTPTARTPPQISVIVPTLNEAQEIDGALESAADPRVELLVIDGSSEDATIARARHHGARVFETVACKAAQLNLGARRAQAPLLLFLHADARLPRGWFESVFAAAQQPGFGGGAFRLRIDSHDRVFRLIEWMVRLRSKMLALPYGDQALFISASAFERMGGFAEIEFMEDFEFVRRLGDVGPIKILPQSVRVSARRWQRLGAWRVTLINQWVVFGYLIGMTPERLGRWYRSGRLWPPSADRPASRNPHPDRNKARR
jgi:rSAM/selenodomain-associated transferase 2